MTDLVSQYIKKGLNGLYYAFYVIIEGLLKVSHSWNPIISITGAISVLVAIPLIGLIRLLTLFWMDIDIPVKIAIIIGIVIWGSLYCRLYHYYLSVCEKIEQRFQKDNMLTRIVFGMLAIAVTGILIYASSWLSDVYLSKWKNT